MEKSDIIKSLQDKLAVVNAQDTLNEARYVQVKNALAKQAAEINSQITELSAPVI